LSICSNSLSVTALMVKHKIFLSFSLLEIIVLSILFLYGHATVTARSKNEMPSKKELVRYLKLTDLSLWTEARYTRHPSQADIFTPFQDFPSSPEHFPAGSIIAPENIISSTKKQAGRFQGQAL